MGFNCGIAGLPNVGKSTIFNALTASGATAENYPFCTIEPNVGIVPVPDPRLARLAQISNPAKITPTTLEVVDIAGLVAGASKGEGLGNRFLGHIRQVDAIAHVVRCFEDENIAHVAGKVNPADDVETIRTELLLADMETLEKRMESTRKKAKADPAGLLSAVEKYTALLDKMNNGVIARLAIEPGDEDFFSDLFLITAKPMIYVLNVKEDDLGRETDMTKTVREIAERDGAGAVKICGKIEAELAELEADDKKAFLADMGLSEPGLDHFIREGYALLGLITFFTTGPTETRAWTTPKGSLAPQAAGVIHSDFERGFIKAEIMSYEDLNRLGAEQAVRENGLMRMEGKDYVMKDGDVVFFRFNV